MFTVSREGISLTRRSYNAVISTSQTGLDYDIVFITKPFLTGASFSNDTDVNLGGLSRSDLLSLQSDAIQSKLVNLTSETCLQEFSGTYQTAYDAVLLVVETASTTTSLVQTGQPGTSLETYSAASKDTMSLDGSLVQYCLARAGSSQTCDVTASTAMLGVVSLSVLAAFSSIVVILVPSKFEPLATLGDAIRSFLQYPDSTTKGESLIEKQDVRAGRWGCGEAKYFVPSAKFWFSAPSVPRWLLMFGSWATLVAPAAVALGELAPTDPAAFTVPFGTATPYTAFVLPLSVTKTQMALLACLPQLLLAILYLVTNAHLTTYYLSHELSCFTLGSRRLRVSSDPTGSQTTSLYLTLPRPVSWALLALFVAMAFVLSQAVSMTIITISPSTNESEIITITLSVQALVVLLGLLFLLIIVVVALGLRRVPVVGFADGQGMGNPLALKGGSCSAVLSAKCHPVAGEIEPWKQELTWGVVAEGFSLHNGRCGFSSSNVGPIHVGRVYA